ncbi:MAG: dihydroorotate dehydrogenase-like protein [bacterium]|nr:dihydroorotate dehydrogenase-like protein [bacterium]
MPDLSTNYLGLRLENPLVVSPGPLCESLDNIRLMEDNGAGAVVLHSLFEEQITRMSLTLDADLSRGGESFAESLSYFPELADYRLGPDAYLSHLQQAKQAVSIPVIGSLNGISSGGWIDYARQIEEAGADALELNIYFLPTDPEMDAAAVENQQLTLVRQVVAAVSIPVAVKIGPFFSSLPNISRKFKASGASGLVLFNRFYQPGVDINHLDVVPSLHLSTSDELGLRLRWAAILSSVVDVDLAITGGVHTGEDVLKSMMAGGKVAMMTSALLKRGIPHLRSVLSFISAWMEEKEYESIRQMQGSMSFNNVPKPAEYVRANYMKVLSSYSAAADL